MTTTAKSLAEQKQAIFDTVVSGLIAQGGPSRFDTGNCAYRGANGRKCAAGLLIKDDLYHSSLETQPCSNEPVQVALIDSGVQPECINLVRGLQLAHDSAAMCADTDSEWLALFLSDVRHVAREQGLHLKWEIPK